MFKQLRSPKTHKFLIESLSCLCDKSGSGTGTVVNRDGIFSESEAANENKYFREKSQQKLQKLKKNLEERKKNKDKVKNTGEDGSGKPSDQN